MGIKITLSKGFLKRSLVFHLLLFVNLCSFAASYSQRITSQAGEVSLKMALDIISQQAGVEFFYSDDEIDLTQVVKVNLSKATIEEALERVLGKHYETEIERNNVILIKKRSNLLISKAAEQF